MTAPSGIRSGVGFRYVRVFELTTAGYPAATSPTTPYEGTRISGAKVLELTEPDPRQIVHVGDDRPFALDALPADTPITGRLTVAKKNDVIDAIVTQANAITIGEASMMVVGNDQRGNEPQVALLAYRQSLETDDTDTDFGSRLWESRIIPKCLCIPNETGFSDTPEEAPYTLWPQFVTKHLWGAAFALGTEGVTRGQVVRGVTQYKPKIVAWKANNTATTFTFPAAYPAVETAKIEVWVNGVLQSTEYTSTTSAIAFTTAPTTDAMVVVFYEVAND